MQFLFKNLSKYLLIPLVESFFKWAWKKIQDWQKERIERKALEEANREIRRKVDKYESASADDAFDSHP